MNQLEFKSTLLLGYTHSQAWNIYIYYILYELVVRLQDISSSFAFIFLHHNNLFHSMKTVWGRLYSCTVDSLPPKKVEQDLTCLLPGKPEFFLFFFFPTGCSITVNEWIYWAPAAVLVMRQGTFSCSGFIFFIAALWAHKTSMSVEDNGTTGGLIHHSCQSRLVVTTWWRWVRGLDAGSTWQPGAQQELISPARIVSDRQGFGSCLRLLTSCTDDKCFWSL